MKKIHGCCEMETMICGSGTMWMKWLATGDNEWW
ncbi:hypothetical protein SLEP1_g12570 [Rubroshorea leprosula]|uniref:Uncharacterized protein n=1 Tax=Rubroshorea leprosula TaxID=152421 RepID=A0AAV5IMD7_9ROSI|nr:hypothetical protein SLEP1_g12570 [Rubroshorea leprosula]